MTTSLRDLGHRIATAIERDRLGQVHSSGGPVDDSTYDLSLDTVEGEGIEIVIRRAASPEPGRPEFHDKGLEITATRSQGTDGAVVVFIDTPNWEPDGSDGGPGLRVLINEWEAYNVIPHTPNADDAGREAREVKLTCTLDEIDYPVEAHGTCRHCDRHIEKREGRWVDPEATGDDSVWRETCDAHDTFVADHEPVDDDEVAAAAEDQRIIRKNNDDEETRS